MLRVDPMTGNGKDTSADPKQFKLNQDWLCRKNTGGKYTWCEHSLNVGFYTSGPYLPGRGPFWNGPQRKNKIVENDTYCIFNHFPGSLFWKKATSARVSLPYLTPRCFPCLIKSVSYPSKKCPPNSFHSKRGDTRRVSERKESCS